jgi:hypothetical protein
LHENSWLLKQQQLLQQELLVLPSVSRTHGFSCQVWLAFQLQRLLGDRYYVWFATELNPMANGPSSNPLKLYWMLDEAVKTNDWNNAKIKDLEANLLVVIDQRIGTCDRARAQRLIEEIAAAPIEMFRPQLWRLDLSKVQSARWDKTEARDNWDEQLVRDLTGDEFEVIVE